MKNKFCINGKKKEKGKWNGIPSPLWNWAYYTAIPTCSIWNEESQSVCFPSAIPEFSLQLSGVWPISPRAGEDVSWGRSTKTVSDEESWLSGETAICGQLPSVSSLQSVPSSASSSCWTDFKYCCISLLSCSLLELSLLCSHSPWPSSTSEEYAETELPHCLTVSTERELSVPSVKLFSELHKSLTWVWSAIEEWKPESGNCNKDFSWRTSLAGTKQAELTSGAVSCSSVDDRINGSDEQKILAEGIPGCQVAPKFCVTERCHCWRDFTCKV